ncbi:alpha/beta hydrolase fold domain-containing protein [Streptomyces blattellae]|uniref:alpha/beta hydrolase fold domain-containing protein n=1 Tax=Streptomyces blattellae TaxID=2569855 RepID=UPI0012B989CF|nr:alpha/beta hydrolase fold domain-containing protein [Streptomyces blattellae]
MAGKEREEAERGQGARAELALALDWVAALRGWSAQCSALPQVREVLARMAPLRGAAEPGVDIRQIDLDGVPVEVSRAMAAGPDGVPVEVSRATAADPDGPVLLHFHGGGFTIGGPWDDRLYLSRMALALGGSAVSVGYRLAPEHPYPAAVHDGTTAYRALLESGVDARRVIVSGGSAGGGLALLVLREARRLGLPGPAGLVLQSPLVDFTVSGRSHTTNAATDPLTSRESIARAVTAFLAGADAAACSPLFGDLAALPPTLVQVGQDEVLLDDTLALVKEMSAAGVAVSHEVWPDVLHTWHGFGCLTAARVATERLASFARAQTAIPAPRGAGLAEEK